MIPHIFLLFFSFFKEFYLKSVQIHIFHFFLIFNQLHIYYLDSSLIYSLNLSLIISLFIHFIYSLNLFLNLNLNLFLNLFLNLNCN